MTFAFQYRPDPIIDAQAFRECWWSETQLRAKLHQIAVIFDLMPCLHISSQFNVIAVNYRWFVWLIG